MPLSDRRNSCPSMIGCPHAGHRGYFNSEEILACEEAGITVTLPKPMTSNSKAEIGDERFVGSQDVSDQLFGPWGIHLRTRPSRSIQLQCVFTLKSPK
jgi:hypothetical protein